MNSGGSRVPLNYRSQGPCTVNASIKLLDKYVKACAIKQDKDLAAKLRVTKSAVSNWRTGRAHPDAESIERMCEATGEPLARWLPLIESERARSPGAAKAWLRLAQAAACVTIITGITLLTSTSLHASEGVKSFNNADTYIHYAQWRIWLRRLARKLLSPSSPSPRTIHAQGMAV
jgi:transcriptional regulator with XRE-family HTH domain